MALVPRQATGRIEEDLWADGKTVSFRLRVRAYGRRHVVTFGTNHEGWSRERVEVERDTILAEIKRKTWTPPSKESAAAQAATAIAEEETIHHTMSRLWSRKKTELSPNSTASLEWQITHILAFRKDTPTAAIDEQWVDELRDHLAALPNQNNGKPLSPTSVNKVLGGLAQALDLAVDHKVLPANPARGRRRKMTAKKSRGAYLMPDMVVDLIEEAGAWEQELRDRGRADQCYGRRSLVAALCLCGPRIHEAIDADEGHFDIHSGLWRIPDSKTEAGVRLVEMPLFAASEIRGHVAQKHLDGRATGADEPMWPTSKGTRHSANNIRRMLRTLVRRVNEKRAAEGKMELPKVTPHVFRRTFACLCFWAGRELPWVMDQIGHDDSRVTVEIYARAAQRKRIDRALVWSLMRFPDEPEQRPGGRQIDPAIDPLSSKDPSEGAGSIPPR